MSNLSSVYIETLSISLCLAVFLSGDRIRLCSGRERKEGEMLLCVLAFAVKVKLLFCGERREW